MYYRCQGMRDKETRLAEILNVVTVGQCIVFVHTREAVRLTFTLTPAPPPPPPRPHVHPRPSPLTVSRWTSLLRC